MSLWDQISDVQRDGLVADVVAGLGNSAVPDHLRPGLVRYFADGILPGGFLQAVLINDLTQAVERADPQSSAMLPVLVWYLSAHAPACAWGSREKVLAWTTTPDRLEV